MNRRRSERRCGCGDAGRVILEALVGLSLIAIAVVSWGRVAVVGARAEANADHRATALELAASELEQLSVRHWDNVAIDPAGPGSRRNFEGEPVVLASSGVDAESTVTIDGLDFRLLRVVTDPGAPSWRRLIVEVTWPEGGLTSRVRLDGAAIGPDGSGGP